MFFLISSSKTRVLGGSQCSEKNEQGFAFTIFRLKVQSLRFQTKIAKVFGVFDILAKHIFLFLTW